jgi:hypothetical protein
MIKSPPSRRSVSAVQSVVSVRNGFLARANGFRGFRLGFWFGSIRFCTISPSA